jgi:hypothetical protein
MVAAVGESNWELLGLGLSFVVLALVPGLVSFLRPSWVRIVVVVGVIAAAAIWVSAGFFGGTGEMDRIDDVLLTGMWVVVMLGLWSMGAWMGQRLRRRRTERAAA